MRTEREKELEALKREYERIVPPADGLERMEEAMKQAEKEKQKRSRTVIWKRAGIGVAAALALFILLPNLNASVAMAMEKIPLIGGLVKVVTFNRYDYMDETHDAHVEVPRIEVEPTEQTETGEQQAGTDVEKVNIDIEQYANEKIEEFKADLSEDAVKGLTITYDVLTNTDDWFSLRLNILEVMASGYEQQRFYNIDKRTGREVKLADLFTADADYTAVLSENIKQQMRERTAADDSQVFFLDNPEMPEDNFQSIKEDQNFYVNDKGELVIAFDEYEVAPGYMGTQEFVIPAEAVAGIRA